jgi:hypothetical protein
MGIFKACLRDLAQGEVPVGSPFAVMGFGAREALSGFESVELVNELHGECVLSPLVELVLELRLALLMTSIEESATCDASPPVRFD